MRWNFFSADVILVQIGEFYREKYEIVKSTLISSSTLSPYILNRQARSNHTHKEMIYLDSHEFI